MCLLCSDTDECASGLDNCDQVCSNDNGGFSCSCLDGFQLLNNSRTCEGTKSTASMSIIAGIAYCVDIDECAISPCDANAQCRNVPGTFLCVCNTNFIGDGFNCSGTYVLAGRKVKGRWFRPHAL